MDVKKFGAFISDRRKQQHMTQAELAGKIGVTDKAGGFRGQSGNRAGG